MVVARARQAGAHLHRRRFEADADQLHAVVGLDEHLREVGGRRDAVDSHHLRAERLPHANDDLLSAARLRIDPTDLFEVGLHRGQPLLLRIDRAADRAVGGMPRRKRAERCNEIFEQNDRAARLCADGAATGVGHPGLGGARDHDLTALGALARIDKDILHAGDSGELRELLGDAPARRGRLRDLRFEPGERDHAQLRTLLQVAFQLRHGRLAPGGEFAVDHDLRAEHAIGIDHDAGCGAKGTHAHATHAHATHAHATHAATHAAAHLLGVGHRACHRRSDTDAGKETTCNLHGCSGSDLDYRL